MTWHAADRPQYCFSHDSAAPDLLFHHCRARCFKFCLFGGQRASSPRPANSVSSGSIHLYRKTGRKASDVPNTSALLNRGAEQFLPLHSLLGLIVSLAEEFMKAVLALIVIYVGAFLLAIQGSSP